MHPLAASLARPPGDRHRLGCTPRPNGVVGVRHRTTFATSQMLQLSHTHALMPLAIVVTTMSSHFCREFTDTTHPSRQTGGARQRYALCVARRQGRHSDDGDIVQDLSRVRIHEYAANPATVSTPHSHDTNATVAVRVKRTDDGRPLVRRHC